MRTLLIDGDMVAYRVAAAEEKTHTFDGVNYHITADAELGKSNMDAMVDAFVKHLGADHVIMTLTHKDNFRYTVLPTYKSNRKGARKPLILDVLKDHLRDTYETVEVPGLEADDILGIFATHPKRVVGEKIIVTWDKDLRTVPGLHWNPDKDDGKPPVRVSEKEADAAFYAQVLSGDAVDGYAGCPGMGKKRAEELVRNPVALIRTEEEIKRGPNKGNMRTRYVTTPTNDIWEAIVSHYEKAGLTADDALTSARVARILRHTDYNFKTREPILWSPTNR